MSGKMLGLIFAYCGYTVVGYRAGVCEDRVIDATHIESTVYDEAYLERDGVITAQRLPLGS